MRKELLTSADFMQGMLDSVPSLLFLVDGDVRIYNLNRAARETLGPDGNMVLMKRGGEALHCIHSYEDEGGCGRAAACGGCVVRGSVGRALSGERVFREYAAMKLVNNGSLSDAHFLVTASPFKYGKESFILLAFEDVTRLKKAEEALSRRTAELEEANRELEAFSYSVAHDLQAPLRAIGGFSASLLEDYADNFDETARGYLGRVIAASGRMAGMIEHLLELSRVGRCELTYEQTDLSVLAREVEEELRCGQPERRAEFIIEPDAVVRGDRHLLRLVLQNLLGNAWKFTAGRAGARIEFGKTEQNGEKVFFVRDNGAGFDPEYAERLFTPFQRLHGEEEFPGIGIGLAAVKRAVCRHGGRIWAEGKKGRGATFYFTF